MAAIVQGLPNGLGSGINYWTAEFLPLAGARLANFDESSFFDKDGNTLPALEAFGQIARTKKETR